jgi:iron-sulfur cluster assembly protein
MVQITESAGSKINELLSEQENKGLFLRVGVRPGGCSGFSYGMGFDEELHDDDKEFVQQGIRVVVDSESARHLDGVIIDYKESLVGGGFTIDNPNAVATCGCGSSFRTATDAGQVEKCED